MTPFAKHFHLKDSERTDFRLSTAKDEDLRLYVDLDGVLPRLQTEIEAQTPRFVLQGDYGSGKSHVLRYVERFLAQPRLRSVYVLISGFHRRSDFFQVHQQLIASLLPLAQEAAQAPGDKVARIEQVRGITDNMRRALQELAIPSIAISREPATTAGQWLSGSRGLTSARMAKAGYTRLLQEEAGPDRLVALYKAISDLYYEAFQRRLLLLLDEAESFTRVVDIDAQASIGSAMRAFFDGENQSLGFFLGLNTPQARHGAHPMLRSDVQSRIGKRQLELRPLSTPERITLFLEKLWPKLTGQTDLLPFLLDRGAMNLVGRRLDELSQLVSVDSVSASSGPRDLLNVMSYVGEIATEQRVSPIKAEHLRTWFGLGGT